MVDRGSDRASSHMTAERASRVAVDRSSQFTLERGSVMGSPKRPQIQHQLSAPLESNLNNSPALGNLLTYQSSASFEHSPANNIVPYYITNRTPLTPPLYHKPPIPSYTIRTPLTPPLNNRHHPPSPRIVTKVTTTKGFTTRTAHAPRFMLGPTSTL